MAIQARIRELIARHRTLESSLEAEMKHPAMNTARVSDLKKQKLRLKDEISALENRA